MLCSWFFKHFLASHIMFFDGIRRGFVPKVVPKAWPMRGELSEDFSYQIVASAFDKRISRSAVTNVRPSTSAVAPIKRSAGSLG